MSYCERPEGGVKPAEGEEAADKVVKTEEMRAREIAPGPYEKVSIRTASP